MGRAYRDGLHRSTFIPETRIIINALERCLTKFNVFSTLFDIVSNSSKRRAIAEHAHHPPTSAWPEIRPVNPFAGLTRTRSAHSAVLHGTIDLRRDNNDYHKYSIPWHDLGRPAIRKPFLYNL